MLVATNVVVVAEAECAAVSAETADVANVEIEVVAAIEDVIVVAFAAAEDDESSVKIVFIEFDGADVIAGVVVVVAPTNDDDEAATEVTAVAVIFAFELVFAAFDVGSDSVPSLFNIIRCDIPPPEDSDDSVVGAIELFVPATIIFMFDDDNELEV